MTRYAGPGLACLLTAALLAGCGGAEGGDDGGGADQTTSASTSSPTSSPTSSAASTSAASTSAPTGPSASADGVATGPEVSMDGFTARIPEGWELTKGDDSRSTEAFYRQEPVGTILFDSNDSTGLDLQFWFEQSLQNADVVLGVDPQEQAPRTVGGAEARVITGSSAKIPTYYEVVALHEGYVLDIQFEINAELDDPQALVDSVLDSVQLLTPPAA